MNHGSKKITGKNICSPGHSRNCTGDCCPDHCKNLALNLCEIPLILGVPVPVCNILAGILYVVFTYIGVKILCGKFLKISMAEMRIPKFQIKAFWILGCNSYANIGAVYFGIVRRKMAEQYI